MKAQIISQFGDPSVFQAAELEKPTVIPGHVVIKVAATSVNQIDCKIRSGAVPAIAPAFPAVLHGDVAGTVVAVADNVKNFKVGDDVYGFAGGMKGTPGGALAEFMLADADLLALKPHSYTILEAAALPLVGITAWEALFVKIRLQAGMKILIHGGLGGVGHIAVQLAKYTGATVYTTVLDYADFALAKSLGADEVIHAKEESVEEYVQRCTQGKGFDIVFDTVGGPNLDRSLQAAGIRGHVVTTAARSTHDLTFAHHKALSLHVVFVLLPLVNGENRADHGRILVELAKIADQGKLKVLIDKNHFTLDTVREAHVLLESGKARGKVVLSVN